MSRLFLGNIPFGFTENQVRAWMEAEGFAIAAVELIHDRQTGQFRGFGFATLADSSQATLAVESLNRKRMFGRPITVGYALALEKDSRKTA
jgi:RNA recognition motif-containing protein